MERQKRSLRVFGIFAAVVLVIAGGAYLADFQRAEATEATETSATETSADEAKANAEQQTSETDAAGEKTKKIPVEVALVETGSVSSFITASANLVPENDVKVLSEADGRIAEVKVEEGDRVHTDQVLATLIRDEAEIAMNKAKLRAANAELALKRAKETIEQGLISREEFDRLQMEHEVARQEVAEAEWKLSKTSIRAPFGGLVTERMVKQGQHVRPGDEMFSVADFEPLIAYIYLSERDVLQLAEGRQVRITLAADAAIRCRGKIRQISPVVDTATGTVKVTVEALQPPSQVRPGAFVSVDIVREQRQAVVVVPRQSVIRELRTAHVFIREGDEAVKRTVTLGLEEGDMIEILDGVAAGEQVIVAGQGGLKSGAKIRVL